jgi:polar amino acid transport system substrate-binding protein
MRIRTPIAALTVLVLAAACSGAKSTPSPTLAPPPTIVPSIAATIEPTAVPTVAPTKVPTPEPTREPTPEPTKAPTPEPTREPTPEPTKAPTPEPTREPTAEPTVVPTVEPTIAASIVPPTGLSGSCANDKLTLKSPGRLTVGTDNPAYPPWYGGEPPAGSEWQISDPASGQGFESATAYAVAKALGFSRDQVVWVYVPFNSVFTPGPTTFDIYLAQTSVKPERADAVDFSDSYFENTQALVALSSNPITKVTTISGLKAFKLGTAPVGSTGFDVITNIVAPTAAVQVYDDLDKALQLGLLNGGVDGLVVDLPTAFYMRDGQIENYDTPDPEGAIVGTFPKVGEGEHFGIVLEKGSSLTACVNEALAAIKANNTLQGIYDEWIADKGGAPVFAP